jgi:hypothetical protein
LNSARKSRRWSRWSKKPSSGEGPYVVDERDLGTAMREGKFREDLYFRLNEPGSAVKPTAGSATIGSQHSATAMKL